jgi:hypothetical protein
LQGHIDIFLGGQRTKESANKAGLTVAAAVYPELVRSVTITRVLKCFKDDGKELPNSFKIQMIVEYREKPPVWVDSTTEHGEALLHYHPKDGTWFVVGGSG